MSLYAAGPKTDAILDLLKQASEAKAKAVDALIAGMKSRLPNDKLMVLTKILEDTSALESKIHDQLQSQRINPDGSVG